MGAVPETRGTGKPSGTTGGLRPRRKEEKCGRGIGRFVTQDEVQRELRLGTGDESKRDPSRDSPSSRGPEGGRPERVEEMDVVGTEVGIESRGRNWG